MAVTGRKPTPTARKKLAGNPGHRPLNTSEPMPAAKAPKCPTHLGPEAKRAWRWLTKILRSMGMLAESDLALMTLYCDTWGQYVAIRKQVDKVGPVLVSKEKGTVFMSPHLTVESMLKKQLMRCLSELGLSPTSRTRLHVSKPQEVSGKKRFFDYEGIGLG